MKKEDLKRRDFLMYSAIGISGAAVPGILTGCGGKKVEKGGGTNPISEKVRKTMLIDTHEHLINESGRVKAGPTIGHRGANDWTLLLSHYFNSDIVVSGMTQEVHDRFFSPDIDPIDKWKLFEPFWPFLKYTGYGQNVRHSIREVYGIDELNKSTLRKLNDAYHETIKPGYYRRLLRDIANIESCQVDCWPFLEPEQPDLLMNDIHISRWIEGDWDPALAGEAGVTVTTLFDWHRVIDYWMDTWGTKAVAAKCAMAYHRDIDFVRTPAEKVEKSFAKKLAGQKLLPGEKKALEDHLFWYTVDRAADMDLPVKMHTGYYVGHRTMPLDRVRENPASACLLCRQGPDTDFVFFHICYPYYEEMLAVAKHYPNAYMDMCWSWIINPIAAKDFLKKFIVTVPLNKIFTFGGDYFPVELVPGHAIIARQGLARALYELVDEGWITQDEALKMTDVIMHQNARRLYKLDKA